MRSRRGAILSIALCALLALAGCGGGDKAPEPPKLPPAAFAENVKGPARAPALAAEDYVTALNAGDGEAICGFTSVSDKALARCKDQLAGSFDARTQLRYRLLSAKLTTDREAEIRLLQLSPKPKPGDPTRTLIRLRNVGGDWKVIVISSL